MKTWRLILAEMAYRPATCLLVLTAIATAAALFLAGPTLLEGHAQDTHARLEAMQEEAQTSLAELDKKTKRIMRDLGVNLRIVHRDTSMGDLYTNFKAVDFPEEYVNRLASAPSIQTIVHVVAAVHEKTTWRDRSILLSGVLPVMTLSQKNEEKPHMVQEVALGEVFVGSELGAGLKEGETLEIGDHAFLIRKILPPQGTQEDIQLLLHLHDAQQVIGKPGRIHQILALNCKCKGDRISLIRKEVEGVLPDTKVSEHRSLASAREMERDLVEEKSQKQMELLKRNSAETEAKLAELFNVVTPMVIVAAAMVVAVMTWLNVRERRDEIGLLRALGKSSWHIAALFLGRAVALGALGGAVGACGGWLFARWVGIDLMYLSAAQLPLPWTLILATCLGAPLIAAIASYIPMLLAVTQDPTEVLRF